jgi:uncharacterized protein (DUF111 family)
VEELKDGLQTLGVSGGEIETAKVTKNGIAATKVNVKIDAHQHARHLPDILETINNSRLPDEVKALYDNSK